jgi:hypothetical protein
MIAFVPDPFASFCMIFSYVDRLADGLRVMRET